MKKINVTLCRMRGRTFDDWCSQRDQYVEEMVVETKIYISKRERRRLRIECANKKVELAYEKYVVPRIYKTLRFDITPVISKQDKISLLEKKAPQRELAELRRYFPPKYLRNANH